METKDVRRSQPRVPLTHRSQRLRKVLPGTPPTPGDVTQPHPGNASPFLEFSGSVQSGALGGRRDPFWVVTFLRGQKCTFWVILEGPENFWKGLERSFACPLVSMPMSSRTKNSFYPSPWLYLSTSHLLEVLRTSSPNLSCGCERKKIFACIN